MNISGILWLIFLALLFNTLCAMAVKDFFVEVVGWWRPWLAVLSLVPPLSMVFLVTAVVFGLACLIVNVTIGKFTREMSSFFKSHPPKDKPDDRNLGDIHSGAIIDN